MTIKDAIEKQDLQSVKEILIKTPSAIDEKDEQGIAMPFLAAKTGNLGLVKYIVEYSRASMNLKDPCNRNILHYGAMSGNAALCRYLVEKVGMDILGADANLVTPYQIAYEGKKDELTTYFRSVVESPYEEMYHNPIRTGMFPDPSVVRVGEDYYMVNSSFIFFPCIPISHSRDLVHWEIIGHAITNPEWAHLGDLEGGRGYWAPDISYDKGTFYITATYRLNDTGTVYRRQIVVSSDRPEGPYSEPAYIEEDGIDPSLFHDEDGRHYMLLNRGARILELSADCKRQISEARLLYYGDQKRAPEGPHLLRKDGWYYLFLAEGGTGAGHRISVARSRELFGNYEPCPYNPIMRQNDEGASIWRCGHGKPIQTQTGEWYMVYLCCRKFVRAGRGEPSICSILGRETALDPIRWTADEWPVVNDLKGPSALQHMPKLPWYEAKDDYGMQWVSPREPEKDGIIIDGNVFRIKGSRFPLSDVRARNICLRRQTAFDFSTGVKLSVPDMKEGQEAGITCYYDENSWVSYSVARDGTGLFLQAKEHIGRETIDHKKEYIDMDITVDANDAAAAAHEERAEKSREIMLGVETKGLTRQFFCRIKDRRYESEQLEDVYYLCDEGVSMGKRFTGAMLGMYAYAGGKKLEAEFKDFIYEAL